MSTTYATPGRTATAPRQKAAMVLLVDNDRAYLEMVTLKLELEGHTVVSATDGAVGREIARRQQPDIIFLDVALPGLAELELLARLKGDPATGEIPVVVVSGRCERRVIDESRRLGAADFLVKGMSVAATLGYAVQSFARAHSRGA